MSNFNSNHRQIKKYTWISLMKAAVRCSPEVWYGSRKSAGFAWYLVVVILNQNDKANELAWLCSQSTDLEVADILKSPLCHFTRELELLSERKPNWSGITNRSAKYQHKFGQISSCVQLSSIKNVQMRNCEWWAPLWDDIQLLFGLNTRA